VLSERFRKNIKMEGHSIDGDYFSYEGGVGELPDKKRIEEVRKQEEKAKQQNKEIREKVEKEGCPPENHSFHFTEVDKNSSKIQEITGKESKEKAKVENPSNSDKRERQIEKETNQQNQTQKLDSKDNDSKNIYYGIGAVSLTLLVISAARWFDRITVNLSSYFTAFCSNNLDIGRRKEKVNQLEYIKKAGQAVSNILKRLKKEIKPGVSGKDLDKLARQLMLNKA
ncbi:6716_t:CDS:2, partial [Funneliformis geosporum]